MHTNFDKMVCGSEKRYRRIEKDVAVFGKREIKNGQKKILGHDTING